MKNATWSAANAEKAIFQGASPPEPTGKLLVTTAHESITS